MMKRALCIAVVLSLLCGLAVQAAGKRTITIRSQKYTGPRMTIGQEVWLPLADFAKAMRLQVREHGKVWCLSDAAKPAHACPEAAEPTLCVNGVLVPAALKEAKGVLWVSARSATKALGGKYLDNPSMGMLDIVMPYVAPPEQAKLPASVEVASASVMMVHFGADW